MLGLVVETRMLGLVAEIHMVVPRIVVVRRDADLSADSALPYRYKPRQRHMSGLFRN